MEASAHEATAGPLYEIQHDRAKLGMWLFLGSEVMFFTGFIGSYIVLRMNNAVEALEDQKLIQPTRHLAIINTVVLILSSLTMAMAVASAHRMKQLATSLFLFLTLMLGTTFLVIKTFEYGHKLHAPARDAPLHEGTTLLIKVPSKPDLSGTVRIMEEGSFRVAGLGLREAKSTKAMDLERELRDKLKDPKVTVETRGITPSTSVFFSAYYTMTGFHGLHVLAGVIVLIGLLGASMSGAFKDGHYRPVEISGLYWHLVDLIWIFLFPILYLI